MNFRLVCGGCGTEADPADPYPFRCPKAGTDDGDHVLVRELDTSSVSWPSGSEETNPFVRYAGLFHWAG